MATASERMKKMRDRLYRNGFKSFNFVLSEETDRKIAYLQRHGETLSDFFTRIVDRIYIMDKSDKTTGIE